MDHYDSGFERERQFNLILGQALCDCPVLKARTVKRIIAHVAPKFLDGLFAARPCIRQLAGYIGCGCAEPDSADTNPFFRIGEIYESIDFNGATYSISGYVDGKRRIGSAYFERVT